MSRVYCLCLFLSLRGWHARLYGFRQSLLWRHTKTECTLTEQNMCKHDNFTIVYRLQSCRGDIMYIMKYATKPTENSRPVYKPFSLLNVESAYNLGVTTWLLTYAWYNFLVSQWALCDVGFFIFWFHLFNKETSRYISLRIFELVGCYTSGLYYTIVVSWSVCLASSMSTFHCYCLEMKNVYQFENKASSTRIKNKTRIPMHSLNNVNHIFVFVVSLMSYLLITCNVYTCNILLEQASCGETVIVGGSSPATICH